MKKAYISPVCEGFLTEQEEILAGSVIISSGADDHNPFGEGQDNPPIGGGDDIGGSDDFAKGGMVFDTGSIFD